jgi:hypothetical protein
MDLSTSASYGHSYWSHPLVNILNPPLSVDNICHSVCCRQRTPFLCQQNMGASRCQRPDCSCARAVDCIFIAAAAQGRAFPRCCVSCRMLHSSRLHQPALADGPTKFSAFLEAPFTAMHCFIHFTGDASRRSAMRRHRFQLRSVSCHMGLRGKPAQRSCHRRVRWKRMASPTFCFPAVFDSLLVLAPFCFESVAFVTDLWFQGTDSTPPSFCRRALPSPTCSPRSLASCRNRLQQVTFTRQHVPPRCDNRSFSPCQQRMVADGVFCHARRAAQLQRH